MIDNRLMLLLELLHHRLFLVIQPVQNTEPFRPIQLFFLLELSQHILMHLQNFQSLYCLYPCFLNASHCHVLFSSLNSGYFLEVQDADTFDELLSGPETSALLSPIYVLSEVKAANQPYYPPHLLFIPSVLVKLSLSHHAAS